ncbi:hypothetical protein BDZ90DRAFT_234376 [Jaminaea rosea]|uniref:non-specific serine/threonine protein kinase n=1 Tax=Jaminaea rosea TaxID=1569628 RepID=A0A316UJR5_9BASI|nr:hypothetical protein BDZ90DRAFT_234376 [Jaminaea rosea]PWN25174.1 hypothetical protein BDZ90DRAFT_234376 [Jaminaea rosea]
MVLSSSGGASRINRAPVTYGRARIGGGGPFQRPGTSTTSTLSLADANDDYSDSSSASSSSSDEDGPRQSERMLVEKKDRVKATQAPAPWKKAPTAAPAAAKKKPLAQREANIPPAKVKPLVKAHPTVELLPRASSPSSSAAEPSHSSTAASSSSSSSRKASLAAQRKVQRILSFEEAEQKAQSHDQRHPKSTSIAAEPQGTNIEAVAQALERKLHLSSPDQSADLSFLLSVCSHHEILDFTLAMERILDGDPTTHLLEAEKAGDASYSKVYRLKKAAGDGAASTILKVIPLRSSKKDDESETSSYADVVREIAITRALCSRQKHETSARSSFVELRAAYIARGPLSPVLQRVGTEGGVVQGRSRAAREAATTNASPTLYALLELDDCGVDLESCTLLDQDDHPSNDAPGPAALGLSVIAQVVSALAWAEETHHFEHRDLHWGNVLVRHAARVQTASSSSGLLWESLIDPQASGIEATIIDFTLSRLAPSCGKHVHFYDLSSDPSLFEGDAEVDEQFEVYRSMRNVIGSGAGAWEPFEPRTNVFWARYLVRKVLIGKGLRERRDKAEDGDGRRDDALDMLEKTEQVLNESAAYHLGQEQREPKVCLRSMMQLRDWMQEVVDGRCEQRKIQGKQPKKEQQGQRKGAKNAKPPLAARTDGSARRRSVRRS